ncbi:MAG: type II toxin-antitoxin system VapC family toxin [Burkholderiales bacterium]
MKFWDSSALVPLLVNEPATPKLATIYKEDAAIIAWWGTSVECASALARRNRENKSDAPALAEGFARLNQIRRDWQEIQPLESLRELAVRLTRVHNVRAADALQLAAAIFASENVPGILDFVCLDARLSLSAEREGFNVVSP